MNRIHLSLSLLRLRVLVDRNRLRADEYRERVEHIRTFTRRAEIEIDKKCNTLRSAR